MKQLLDNYLVSTINTTSMTDYICSTVQSKRNFHNSNAMQEATNSTIGAIRHCVNSTVECEHLNTIFLVRLGNQLALVVTNKVDIIRDGLSPVFIRF